MKPLKLILVLVLLMNLTGCWSKLELDELTFVYGLFIDVGEEPGTVEVTISSPLPNRLVSGTQGGGAGDGKSYSMVSKTAPTIPEAILLIQKDLSRKMEASHLKIIVLGKQYAKQGIGDMLEWFQRQPENSLGTYIMAAPGKAKEIPMLTPVFEQLPDQVLNNMARQKIMFSTTIRDCILSESYHMGYAMNYLSFGKKSETSEQGKTEYWCGVDGVMLFQDKKMKAILKVKEGRSLAWAADHYVQSVDSFAWDDDGKGTATAYFLNDKTSSSVKMTPEGPVFHVKLKGRASITSFKDSKQRKADQLSHLLKTKLQEKAVKEVSETLENVQKAGVDVLQLGMLLEWNYPEEWKRLRDHWEDYYSREARIKVTADFKIADFGSEK